MPPDRVCAWLVVTPPALVLAVLALANALPVAAHVVLVLAEWLGALS